MKTYSTSLLVVAFCSWSWSAANAQESGIPSDTPSLMPSRAPSTIPSDGPSLIPSIPPTAVGSNPLSATPTLSRMPTELGASTMPTKAPVDATDSVTPTDSPEMGNSSEAPTGSGGTSPPTHVMFWIALSVAYAIGGPNFL
jgi:hypothetical protein